MAKTTLSKADKNHLRRIMKKVRLMRGKKKTQIKSGKRRSVSPTFTTGAPRGRNPAALSINLPAF